MATVEVYGASDDLIEIEGDIREEFGIPETDVALLAFSDGSILRIEYNDEGMWRISPVVIEPASKYTNVQATDVDDDFSDRATLTGDFKWVALASAWAHTN